MPGWNASEYAIEAELDALEGREQAWRPEDIAIAGVILTIAPDGSLEAERGFVRRREEVEGRPKTAGSDHEEAESGRTVPPFRSSSERPRP